MEIAFTVVSPGGERSSRVMDSVGAAEWNSPSEAVKAPQGLDPVPEGTSQLQPRISNPWLSYGCCSNAARRVLAST